jgi:hypothetical protein
MVDSQLFSPCPSTNERVSAWQSYVTRQLNRPTPLNCPHTKAAAVLQTQPPDVSLAGIAIRNRPIFLSLLNDTSRVHHVAARWLCSTEACGTSRISARTTSRERDRRLETEICRARSTSRASQAPTRRQRARRVSVQSKAPSSCSLEQTDCLFFTEIRKVPEKRKKPAAATCSPRRKKPKSSSNIADDDDNNNNHTSEQADVASSLDTVLSKLADSSRRRSALTG